MTQGPIWKKEDDGEYNEQKAVLPDGRVLTIYSDLNGERWEGYTGTDSADAMTLDADNERDARTEAWKWAIGE